MAKNFLFSACEKKLKIARDSQYSPSSPLLTTKKRLNNGLFVCNKIKRESGGIVSEGGTGTPNRRKAQKTLIFFVLFLLLRPARLSRKVRMTLRMHQMIHHIRRDILPTPEIGHERLD